MLYIYFYMLYLLHVVHFYMLYTSTCCIHVLLHVVYFLQISDFSLDHIGSLESACCPTFSCVVDDFDDSVLDKLLPIVYKTNDGPAHRKSPPRASQGPLFSVAMEMKLDKERNSMVHCKTSPSLFLFLSLSLTHSHTHRHTHISPFSLS